MDLSYLKGVDPDKLYKDHDEEYPCITFFYNKDFHHTDFPDTHDDLAILKTVFYDIFPQAVGTITSFQIEDLLNYKKKDNIPFLDAKLKSMAIDPSDWKNQLGTRGKCLKFGQALAGRIAVLNKELVIAFWQGKEHPKFENFLHDPRVAFEIFKRYGKVMGKEWAVVPMSEEPYLFSPTTKPTKVVEEPKKITKLPLKPEYVINGIKIKAEDMVKLRGLIHSSPPESKMYQAALSILCHPDMHKHPELTGFIPNKCLPKSTKKIDSYLDAGRELYMTSKKPADTSLLYPAYRATSEVNFNFAEWLRHQP